MIAQCQDPVAYTCDRDRSCVRGLKLLPSLAVPALRRGEFRYVPATQIPKIHLSSSLNHRALILHRLHAPDYWKPGSKRLHSAGRHNMYLCQADASSPLLSGWSWIGLFVRVRESGIRAKGAFLA